MALAVIVFLATFFTDIVWVKMVQATTEKQAFAAACYSVLLIGLSGLIFFVFISDPIYLIPEAIGAFLGTYITVKRR